MRCHLSPTIVRVTLVLLSILISCHTPIGLEVIDTGLYAQETSSVASPSSSSPFLASTPDELSPSPEFPLFSRQEVNTGSRDGIQVSSTVSNFTSLYEYVQERADYSGFYDNSTDIQTITYSNAKGKILNATLWLGGRVISNPSVLGAKAIVYGVLVDSDNNQNTGKFGVDFQREIQWNSTIGNWNSLLVEYSSPEHSRTLEFEGNFTGFFDENQTHVLIPLELESITSPSKFKVLYYGLVIYGDTPIRIDQDDDEDYESTLTPTNKATDKGISKIVVDLSSWIDIPPPTYSFLTTPSPIEIVRGEEKEVGIQLVSSSGTLPNSISFLPEADSSEIEIQEISPETDNMSSTISQPVSFRLRVPEGANVGFHSVPVLANISTGTLFPSEFIELPGMNLSVPTENFVTRYVNLTFSVLEPPSTPEIIKDFWSSYGLLISLVAAGFVGGFSTYIFDYIRSKRKND
jgi:hypothetical protein